jgi:glycerol-3-phosphate dehydrogenase (NAD(P)+)
MMYGRITIIGAGSLGRAIEYLLVNEEVQLDLWDAVPGEVDEQKALTDIVPAASAVFLCVPSWSVREAATSIKPYLTEDTIVIALSKGLEARTGLRVDQVLEQVMPNNPVVLLSGPMLAAEIQDDKYAAALIASRSSQALAYCENLFHNTRLILQQSPSIEAVALAGVLKNIYAVLLGIIDGLALGNNVKGWMVAQILDEMEAVTMSLAIAPSCTQGIAGLGDLVATGFSFSSNNHRVGREIALHKETSLLSEGLVSLPALLRLLKGKGTFPLLEGIWAIVDKKSDALDVVASMLQVTKKYSVDRSQL